MGQQSSKAAGVFITHTEPEVKGVHFGNRATIACTMRGDQIVYGIAVCSDGDNFSRRKGRQLAETRMEAGYGVYELVPQDGQENFYKRMNDPQRATALFAMNLRRAVARNYERYKRRIHDFRTQNSTEQSTASAVN